MCKRGTTVTKPLPAFVQQEVRRFNTNVDIDSCIEDVVDALWTAGIVTLSVCCGHGDSRATIVVRKCDAAKANSLCAGRATIMYWGVDTLCEYAHD